MGAPDPSDADLLGDTDEPGKSFSLFYERHFPGILAFCAHQGLDAHDAADVTGDVFVAALRHRARFDPSRNVSAEPWLFGIARNVVLGRYRRSRREAAAHERLQVLARSLSEPDVAEYLALKNEIETAFEAVRGLPSGQRAAVLGRLIDDSSYVELAEVHGVSEEVVRQRTSRGMRTVRARLGRRS